MFYVYGTINQDSVMANEVFFKTVCRDAQGLSDEDLIMNDLQSGLAN